ncbi:hypothetical protein GCM10027418_17720 [Mariniluteicoccus endophyticus]
MSTSYTTVVRRLPVARLGWAAHYLLRVGLALFLFVYGWSKVFLIQMGQPDFGDALVTHGEMSPMGLLWRWMGYSPAVQFLAGAAEVLAGTLMMWRRTAGIGALLGALDMGIVFGMNLAYDVPVKQLSLALTVGCVVVLLPYAARYLHALLTPAPLPQGVVPTVFDGRVGRVTDVLAVLAAVGLTAATGIVWWTQIGSRAPVSTTTALTGVHRVVEDTATPAAQLTNDTRWQQVSFGQWRGARGFRMAVRQANGDLRLGTYRITGPSTVQVALTPPQKGDVPVNRPAADTWDLTFEPQPDGSVRLRGAGQDLRIQPDREGRYLFDREFSWAPRMPVNR